MESANLSSMNGTELSSEEDAYQSIGFTSAKGGGFANLGSPQRASGDDVYTRAPRHGPDICLVNCHIPLTPQTEWSNLLRQHHANRSRSGSITVHVGCSGASLSLFPTA